MTKKVIKPQVCDNVSQHVLVDLNWGTDVSFGHCWQVLLESTTPLLHTLGCLKLLKADKGYAFAVLGRATVPFNRPNIQAIKNS